jgi:drug/metabolite transporter (DMT)-like permease
MNTSFDWAKILPLLIPILIIQIGLQIYALVDLYRQPGEKIKWSKWLWVVIIVLGEILGPIVYFILARKEE